MRGQQFPHGLQSLGSLAHAAGRKFVVWFEPESIANTETFVSRNFPEYTLRLPPPPGCSPPPFGAGCPEGQGNLLFNLGHVEGRTYMRDFLSRAVRQFGLDVLRIDFNTDPAPFWQAADTAKTRGMTEARYVEGLYDLWDSLRQQYPQVRP